MVKKLILLPLAFFGLGRPAHQLSATAKVASGAFFAGGTFVLLRDIARCIKKRKISKEAAMRITASLTVMGLSGWHLYYAWQQAHAVEPEPEPEPDEPAVPLEIPSVPSAAHLSEGVRVKIGGRTISDKEKLEFFERIKTKVAFAQFIESLWTHGHFGASTEDGLAYPLIEFSDLGERVSFDNLGLSLKSNETALRSITLDGLSLHASLYLKQAYLASFTCRSASLISVVFDGCTTTKADFSGSDFEKCYLHGVDLCHSVMYTPHGEYVEQVIQVAIDQGAQLEATEKLKRFNEAYNFLAKSDFKTWFEGWSHSCSCTYIRDSTIKETDLSNADLRVVHFNNVELINSSFEHTDLRLSHFIECNFDKVSFVGAKTLGAWFRDCNLSDSDLSGLDFSRTNMKRTNLRGADLSNTVFAKADLREMDFSNVKLIEGAIFYDARIDTSQREVLQSRGIPEEALQGVHWAV
ncbi:pentapeptide repeat-containing protein [Candidatus Dependentiae bacterium]